MKTLTNTCLLCLFHNKDNKDVSSADEDGVVIGDKFKYVLSDQNITSYYNKIVNHTPDTTICKTCLQILNNIYTFKQKCLNNLRHISDSIELIEMKHKTNEHSTNIKDKSLQLSDEEPKNEEETLVIKVEPQDILKYTDNIEDTNNEIPERVSYNETMNDPVLLMLPDQAQHIQNMLKNEITNFTGYMTPPDFVKRKHQCNECQKTFKRADHLTRHKLIHSDIRPFQCERCDKAFRDRNHLMSHEISHSTEKAFKCLICSKSFKRIDHLRTHEFIHTGAKPYECQVCRKKFRYKKSLSNHELRHIARREVSMDSEQSSFLEMSIKFEDISAVNINN